MSCEPIVVLFMSTEASKVAATDPTEEDELENDDSESSDRQSSVTIEAKPENVDKEVSNSDANQLTVSTPSVPGTAQLVNESTTKAIRNESNSEIEVQTNEDKTDKSDPNAHPTTSNESPIKSPNQPSSDSPTKGSKSATIASDFQEVINDSSVSDEVKFGLLCAKIMSIVSSVENSQDANVITYNILHLLITDDLQRIRKPQTTAKGLLLGSLTQTFHFDDLIKHFIREIINLQTSYSCDEKELRALLKQSEDDARLRHYVRNANLLQRSRPNAFFAFPGSVGSVLALPPIQKWPIQNGWTFITWFRQEPNTTNSQPYLYFFRTSKAGVGYSAHFTGNCLVLTSMKIKEAVISTISSIDTQSKLSNPDPKMSTTVVPDGAPSRTNRYGSQRRTNPQKEFYSSLILGQKQTPKVSATSAFRIPEFRWSPLHLKLLNDIVFYRM